MGWIIDHGWPPLSILGEGNLQINMMRAFQSFWDNEVPPVPQGAAPGPGLQDHYIGAIAAVMRRFTNRSTVAGFEIINEPEPGLEVIPWNFAANTLYPFYRRVVQAVTGIRDGLPTCAATQPIAANCSYPDLGVRDTRHLLFYEPNAMRNLFDFEPAVHEPWTNYSNIVYAPHVYTNEFTLLKNYSYDFAYITAAAEANAMRSAVFVTEFGGGPDALEPNLIPTMQQQDIYQTSATFWSWKSNCVGNCTGYSWTVYDSAAPDANGTGPLPPNGPLRPAMTRALSRTHTRGAVGTPVAYLFNVSAQSYSLCVNVSADDAPPGGPLTDIYIPHSVPWGVTVTGIASLHNVTTWPDGSRTALVAVAPLTAGVYTVRVSPPTGDAGEADACVLPPGPLRPVSAAEAAAQRKAAVAASAGAVEALGAVVARGLAEAVRLAGVAMD